MDIGKSALLALLVAVGIGASCSAQEAGGGILKIGGFRCIDLKALRNDATFDLYTIGYWTRASFRMDVWKRHGVPFWYPAGTGNLRVAGADWQPPQHAFPSSSLAGGVAHADSQAPGNGAIANGNDGDRATYWYSGDYHPRGKLWIEFAEPERVRTVRFLPWATPRHAPKDYSVGLVLPDGTWKETASVHDEKRMGEWIEVAAGDVEAKGIYLDVRATMENEHGPVVYELQARAGTPKPRQGPRYPSGVVIPLGDTPARELFCLGHAGSGFRALSDAPAPVGEYVLRYANGEQETVPLVAGRNVADIRYGSFVPDAEFAFAIQGSGTEEEDGAAWQSYHLDEMLPVEPKRQLLMFSHPVAHPEWPLRTLSFRCTDPRASLVLAGVTLRQDGPRMNALVYGGRRIRPYPRTTPRAAPSPLDVLRDRRSRLSLNGDWQYATDPGNEGVRRRYFATDHDASAWKRMPVPSQWYVQGLDYHGVVWFRRQVRVPAAFPGSVLQLQFGGVDYDARVWVNGELVGRHVGAFAGFALDATRAIRKGDDNLVVVRVDSPIDPGFTSRKTLIKGNSMDDIAMPYDEEGCQGGIFRPVALVGRGDVGIENAWTATTVSQDLKHADVSVRFELSPSTPDARTVQVRCRLREPAAEGARPRTFEVARSVAVAGRTPVLLEIPIDRPKLWYSWDQGQPHLHTLEIDVRQDGALLDRHLSRVGVREVGFEAEKHYVTVNHHRVFLKGMLNDDIHWMSMMDRTGYRQRVRLQRDANLNVIRMVGHQSSPDMYDLCDEMGMLIWQEMPLQWGYSASEPVRRDILNVVRETMLQCRPHASVIGWSAWNEGGQGEFSDRLVASMRELDSTRPMTRACGGGDFDIHIYPNLSSNLPRRSFLWSGVKVGFVSEVGAYGLSSLPEMKEVLGRDLFAFDTAEYYWETFHSYRYCDGPVFTDAPAAAEWPTAKVRDYVLSKIGPSERWLKQFMKFMYENFRAQRFDPTTAAIHCRFDDPMPTAFLGVVNFTGRPRAAYYAVKEACQPVLPILYFDTNGVADVRVVNDYRTRSWRGCTLRYALWDGTGKLHRKGQRAFDLPPDSTVKVLSREELGDVFALPGGLRAELTVVDGQGLQLSRNRYDLTREEIELFVTSVYPPAPTAPYRGILVRADGAAEVRGASRVDAEGCYSGTLLAFAPSEGLPYVRLAAEVPADGSYLVRAACSNGAALRSSELLVDGAKAEPESYPYIDMTQGITRVPYSARSLSWVPGWRVRLARGSHVLELRWPEGQTAPAWLLDAVCLQREAK